MIPNTTPNQPNFPTDPKTSRISITEAFGESLAELLAEKIISVYQDFPVRDFCTSVKQQVVGKRYTERVEIIADNLRTYLPQQYTAALEMLLQIIGPENEKETGMFTHFYWLMPVGKFIEKYGLDEFAASIAAIEEITKRNTGEYAVRPFARRYPEKMVEVCTRWAKSPNFHLRRLASEGLRPKLPWATKLDVWNDNPTPILKILELLKEDKIKFVKKSVANHLRDWMKVNPSAAQKIIQHWSKSSNEHTQWILRHAQR
jgi:3-methyladenine DNA glycosylase AlkC